MPNPDRGAVVEVMPEEEMKKTVLILELYFHTVQELALKVVPAMTVSTHASLFFSLFK